jgi:hypothetical protein
MALELNQSNVDETLKQKKVTVLDFFYLWCTLCNFHIFINKKYG